LRKLVKKKSDPHMKKIQRIRLSSIVGMVEEKKGLGGGRRKKKKQKAGFIGLVGE